MCVGGGGGVGGGGAGGGGGLGLGSKTKKKKKLCVGVLGEFWLLFGGVVDGDVGTVAPVQATPLKAKLVGTGLLPVHAPLKPNDTVPLVATEPL